MCAALLWEEGLCSQSFLCVHQYNHNIRCIVTFYLTLMNAIVVNKAHARMSNRRSASHFASYIESGYGYEFGIALLVIITQKRTIIY